MCWRRWHCWWSSRWGSCQMHFHHQCKSLGINGLQWQHDVCFTQHYVILCVSIHLSSVLNSQVITLTWINHYVRTILYVCQGDGILCQLMEACMHLQAPKLSQSVGGWPVQALYENSLQYLFVVYPFSAERFWPDQPGVFGRCLVVVLLHETCYTFVRLCKDVIRSVRFQRPVHFFLVRGDCLYLWCKHKISDNDIHAS